MIEFEFLVEIANFLNAKDILKEVEKIRERSTQANAELIFPLIGEFSSGKTTLINALTDSKELETATKPTTSTIYEIHFGCKRNSASILKSNGDIIEIDNIADLKNETLVDSKVVSIFDTSTRIPSTTILVDTPGLSSPDPLHKQTLVDFLPYADGVLLVTDVNQQITRSLTDFVELMSLSKRPIYLVITKCDTKSPQELEQVRKHISDNCKVAIQQVACVSAVKDDLKELYVLLEEIQKDKNKIIEQVDKQRISNIIQILLQRISDLLNSSTSDKKLEEALRQQESALHKLNQNIDRLIEETADEISEEERKITRRFETVVFEKFDKLAASKSDNFDSEAVSTINSTSSLLLNAYREAIQDLFQNKVRESRKSEHTVSLNSLNELDLSNLSIIGISYDLELNSLGHQYDKFITGGLKIVAAVGAVVTVGPAILAAAGPMASAGNLISVADTATDVTNIISNRRTVSRIQQAVSMVSRTGEQLASVETYNQRMAQQMGANKGALESVVGFITDKTMGKPQRQRAIQNYMDETLVPDFKREMTRNSRQLVTLVEQTLHQEAADAINQKTETLQLLRQEYGEKKEAYEQRTKQLRDYKNRLTIL